MWWGPVIVRNGQQFMATRYEMPTEPPQRDRIRSISRPGWATSKISA